MSTERLDHSDSAIAAAMAGEIAVPSDRLTAFRAGNAPRLDDYFGAWCIEPIRGLAMMEHVGRMDVAAHVSSHRHEPRNYVTLFAQTDDASEPMAIESADIKSGGEAIAVIEISGTLMKASSSLGSASSTVELRAAIRAAMNDPNVGGLLLKIDSPGGTVSGTSDLADTIATASKKKPVWAFGEDLVASAALWLASQAEQFYANAKTAMIGSIGTVIGLYDTSGRAGQEGVKAKVYATGPLKGAGFPGAEISSEQDAYFQSVVDSTQQHFRQAVATGRKMSVNEVRRLETGGLFTASEAQQNGLIDGIQSFDKTLGMLFQDVKQRAQAKANTQSKGSKTMAETSPLNEHLMDDTAVQTMAERSAVLEELNAFTSRFGSENGAKWFGENVSMTAAMERHCDVLTERLAAQEAEFQSAIEAKDAQIVDLNTRLSQVQLGERNAVSFNDGDKPAKSKSAINHTEDSGLNRMVKAMKVPTSTN